MYKIYICFKEADKDKEEAFKEDFKNLKKHLDELEDNILFGGELMIIYYPDIQIKGIEWT